MDFTGLGMMAGQKRQRIPAPYLADDLIVDILVRLPERPLCRFKCVSRTWRDLISGPVHRRRLAHTDAASGFFYHVHGQQRLFGFGPPPPRLANLNFTALSSSCAPDDGGGGSPAPPPLLDQAAFPFLPPGCARSQVELVDSCNGLLLLRCHSASHEMIRSPRYVVCNPTTHGWAVKLPLPKPLPINMLPMPPPPEPEPRRAPPRRELEFVIERGEHQHPVLLQIVQDNPPDQQHWIESNRPAALAFDPAVSSHFHVFELVEEDGRRAAVKAVRIYSSETGEWVVRSSEWSYRVAYAGKQNACFSDMKWRHHLAYAGSHAYLNGFLHLTATDANNGMAVVASVDTKGETWRVCGPELPAALGGGAPAGVVGQSQRRLLYVDAGSGNATAGELSVYALESSGGGAMERWVLKHRAGRSVDSSGQQVWFGKHHSVVGIHPDCSVIFLFDSREQSLIAYDMDHGTTRVVHTFTDETSKYYRFVPYVPMYLQSE